MHLTECDAYSLGRAMRPTCRKATRLCLRFVCCRASDAAPARDQRVPLARFCRPCRKLRLRSAAAAGATAAAGGDRPLANPGRGASFTGLAPADAVLLAASAGARAMLAMSSRSRAPSLATTTWSSAIDSSRQPRSTLSPLRNRVPVCPSTLNSACEASPCAPWRRIPRSAMRWRGVAGSTRLGEGDGDATGAWAGVTAVGCDAGAAGFDDESGPARRPSTSSTTNRMPPATASHFTAA